MPFFSQNLPSELGKDDQILAFGVVYEHGFTVSRIYPKSLSDVEIKKQFEEECEMKFDDIYLINKDFNVHILEHDEYTPKEHEHDFQQSTNTQDELKQYNSSLDKQNKIIIDDHNNYDYYEDNNFDNNDDGDDV